MLAVEKPMVRTRRSSFSSRRLTLNFEDRATAVNFPPGLYEVPSETNGTWANEVATAMRTPKHAAATLDHSLKRSIACLHWGVLKSKLEDTKQVATEEFNTQLNRAFAGKDPVGFGNHIIKRLPTARRMERALDTVADTIQNLVKPVMSKSSSARDELPCCQWLFAHKMSRMARRALVKQGICAEWQVIPSQANQEWYNRLNKALVSTYQELECIGVPDLSNQSKLFDECKKSVQESQLMEMKPVWFLDRPRGVWKLFLDTLVVDVTLVENVPVETPVYLAANFELSEGDDFTFVANPSLASQPVADEWEMVG